MAENILESLVVRITADSSGFDKGLDQVTASMSGLGNTASQAGHSANAALTRIAAGGTELQDILDDVTDNMGRAFEDFSLRGKFSFSSLKDVAISSFTQMASSLASSGLESLFGSGGSGLLGGLVSGFGALFGGRADGGMVTAATPYIVGERGPELFVPSVSGAVVPNHRLDQTGPVRGQTNVTVNISGIENAAGVRQSAGQVAVAVRRAVARAERNI